MQTDVRTRPDASPVMYQSWRDLLFLHWEWDADDIQRSLPSGLRVDRHDGRCYLGVVPFKMRRVRPRFVPPMPGVSDFLELNFRTYAYDASGTPGVWFYSLDANQRLAVAVARRFFHLPYHWARMRVDADDDGAAIRHCAIVIAIGQSDQSGVRNLGRWSSFCWSVTCCLQRRSVDCSPVAYTMNLTRSATSSCSNGTRGSFRSTVSSLRDGLRITSSFRPGSTCRSTH